MDEAAAPIKNVMNPVLIRDFLVTIPFNIPNIKNVIKLTEKEIKYVKGVISLFCQT